MHQVRNGGGGLLIYGQPYGTPPYVDFPTIRFFPILVSFLSFSDFKKFFQENFFEKKQTENFDEKNFREKNLRKKFKMENQRKKLESRKFFEKKIRKQGTFKEKKNLQWKKFCKKIL